MYPARPPEAPENHSPPDLSVVSTNALASRTPPSEARASPEEAAPRRPTRQRRSGEDNGLFRKEDAVAPKAGQSKPVRRPFGDDLGCSLPRVWKECRDDRYALILVPGLPTKEPPHYSA